MRTLARGTAIGPYVLEAEVARGGMGAVYRARRQHDGAVVALKVMLTGGATTPAQRERFRREAQLAAGLIHPGIVRVHDAGEVGPLSYIAMDLIEGEPLSARVGRLAPLEAARLVAQVARAVEHAHAHGVIHRDLKPGNVLLRRDDGRALVADFGVARHVESAALTRTGALVGTPHYLSPEQASGLPATSASDVHALGAVLFEALTGGPPFRRDDLASLLVAIDTERPQAPSALAPGTPRALDDVCLAALAKAPAARPGAGDLAAELEAIVAGRSGARRAPLLPLGAAGVVALVALGALLVTPAASGPAPTPTKKAAPPAPSITTEPPPAPPTEPAWVAPLTARADIESLLAAHAALDALEAHEPPGALDTRTRARLIEALEEHDRLWVEPVALDGPEFAAAADRLVFIHWLWHRLDPTHGASPRIREISTRVFMTYLGLETAGVPGERLLAMGRAGVAMDPRELNAYLIVAKATRRLRFPTVSGPLLRVGHRLADELEAPAAAWAELASCHIFWLSERARASGDRGGEPARELVELAHSARARGDVPFVHLRDILVHAAGHASDLDEALSFVADAEALGPPLAYALFARAQVFYRHARGDRGLLERAALEGERAAEQARAEGNARWARDCYAFVANVQGARNEPALAIPALERALSLSLYGAGLALRRVLLMIETGDVWALRVATDDLLARARASVERARSSGAPAETVALFEALVETAQGAVGRAPVDVRARLQPWRARADALDALE
jgi:hypothetical protein